jgi:hypothetical protein
MPSFRFLEHPHALAHQRGPRHHLAAHLAVSHIDLHLLHPPNSLPIPSGYSRPRYLSGYSLHWVSMTSLVAHVSLGNGARVRPLIMVCIVSRSRAVSSDPAPGPTQFGFNIIERRIFTTQACLKENGRSVNQSRIGYSAILTFSLSHINEVSSRPCMHK